MSIRDSHGALGQEARPEARIVCRLPFLGPGARPLIALKLVELHLPPERSGISPHPQVPFLWKPSSFLDWRVEEEEEVWMATMGWIMTWSRQVEAWAEKEEAWAVISSAHPSSAGPRLGQEGWWEASF